MIYVNDIIKKLEAAEPVNDDYEDLNAPWNIIQSIIDDLPNVWKDDLDWTEVEAATNGDELLFKYEADCERVADAIDDYVFGYGESHTGYYDPYEDAKSGETDANTGWYYIDFD